MELSLDEAIVIARKEVKDPFARTYLDAIPKAIEGYGMDGLESQVLYALANMRSWHGETAKRAKKAMRDWVKDYQKSRQAATLRARAAQQS